jgi:uncharacterized repeat protein (TIGR01451 family)
MPAGAVTNATLASAAIEDQVTTLLIPTTAFVAGTNEIAVEIHQSGVSSSDLSFNLKLDGSNDNTFNSTTADLNLSACSQVLWAGLYWGATQGSSGTNMSWITGENTVKLKLPGAGSYIDVTASQVDYHNNTLAPGLPHTGYRSFADITSLLNATSPNGTYTVANVNSPTGISNTSAGWTIVIAYANPSEIPRNLTVFDGSAIIDGGGAPLDVSISGFLTPLSGPVSCELGAIVFDGDRTSLDEFSFKEATAGGYTNLTPNATSNLNDMWNSTITYKGANVTTRNPAHLNTHGYDADIILLPNAGNATLGNNKTAATVRFSSPSENYFVQVLSTSISVVNPSFNLAKTATDVNGGSLNPGDVLRYQMDYNNVGNDVSTGTQIIDRIPANTSYKPGSLSIDGVAKTDAAGDDEAEYDFANNRVVFRVGSGANAASGGNVTGSGTGTVRFEVYAPTSCAVIACNNTITNSGRVDYTGQTSAQALSDSSGYFVAGCYVKGPVSNTISGTCTPQNDVILVNQCPATSVTLQPGLYGGYQFYNALPFSSATAIDPSVPITSTQTIYAFNDGPGSCNDTLLIRVYINPCPDIDDDNDGIPDYVEANMPAAFLDHDSDGIPNYLDVNYPGFTDNNADGVNDLFDPGGDSDNDGILNFLDTDFPGFTDVNGDGVNDNFDMDKDGIPNHLDLDSDNDGIPDVVESFGVDSNGDGRIDNYTDTDADGLSQNVDGNATGISGSGTGLGAVDTDGDGVPNYLDLDSDNDGIPDVQEVYGTDLNNDGRIDGFIDFDGDGLSDTVDGDVGNDGIAENMLNALLRTGSDANNDGRCDSFPYNNMDADSKPNPYDLDSDADGITDVIEAQFTDANYNGQADGGVNSDGWNTAISSLGSLVLPNRDGTGRPNAYDIDSDDDGIPDNVEGLATSFYLLPSGTDADGDGIDDTYDTIIGFGGRGVSPYNHDGDAYPDYLDRDTDGDGLDDIIEGNDFNFNQQQDDLVTLTGSDTDGDGLDDRFDTDNTSCKGTSAYMGNGGTTSGPVSPGSSTVVQKSHAWEADRDWRTVEYVLSCRFVSFTTALDGQQVQLKWAVISDEAITQFLVERSTDGTIYTIVKSLGVRTPVRLQESYSSSDEVSLNTKVYYRIRAISQTGKTAVSPVSLLSATGTEAGIEVVPNPVRHSMQVMIRSSQATSARMDIFDAGGRKLYTFTEKLSKGRNSLIIDRARTLPSGSYYMQVSFSDKNYTISFQVRR